MNIGFKSLHPVTAFVFFVFAFIISLTLQDPILLAVVFSCSLIYDVKLRGRKAVSYILKFILPLILLVTVFNGLFSHYGVTVLFVMKSGNNFTLESVVYGFVSAVRIASMLLWLDCFNEILESDKIIFLFGRISPSIALILSMVLRFIPLIRSQSEEIAKAEKGIGNSPESLGFIAKIREGSRRLSILVSWTLEKGIDTSNSMRSRGYGLHGRTAYNSYDFSQKDAIITSVSLVAAVFVFAFSRLFAASYNPIIDIAKFTPTKAALTVFFALVMLIPVTFDITEEKRWSISN